MGKYGKTIPYDPLWKGPYETNRRKTDVNAFRTLVLFLAIWLGIGAYAYHMHANRDQSNPTTNATKSIEGKLTDLKDEYFVHWNKYYESFDQNKGTIFTHCGLAVLLSIVYLVLVRYFAKLMVWTALILFWILLTIFDIILFAAQEELQKDDHDKNMYFSAGLTTFIIVTIIIALIFRKRIAIACAVIKESCKTVLFFPCHFLLPIIVVPMILSVWITFGFIAFWLTVADASEKELTGGRMFFHFILHCYNFFGVWWAWSFVNGFKKMILSSSYAIWYWTMNKKYVPRGTLTHSISTVASYHLGTISFGSLVITFCDILKFFLSLFEMKQSNEEGCSAGGFITGCCITITHILEKYIKFISQQAYIMSAIHGTDFCTSAKNAFNLVMRNILNVATQSNVTNCLIFGGKLFICFAPAIMTYFKVHDEHPESATHAASIVFVISGVIATSFFNVLKTAIDTVFICVLEDYERNDGSEERPYYMNYKLKTLLFND